MASMMSRSRAAGQKKRDEAKAKAAAAKKGSEKTARRRGKQGVGGPGTIVEGSAPDAKTSKLRKAGTVKAPKAKTPKANFGAGERRAAAAAAAAAAAGPPRSVRAGVRKGDNAWRRGSNTAGESPAEKAAAKKLLGTQTFGQAFKEARAKAKKAGDAGGGKFKWTNAQGVTDTFNTITDDDNKASAARDAKTRAQQKALMGFSQDDRSTGTTISKPSKKGFFGKLGDKVKKATTLTKDRPRKPLGSAAKSPTKMRKYKSDMKAWRAKQESSNAKSAGGRVGKTAARTSVKKKSPRRP